MFERRLEITFDLTLLSPLHLGSGSFDRRASRDPRSASVQRRGAAEEIWVATIQRDVNGMPVLPGTTVKGMLRRLMPQAVGDSLCGKVSDFEAKEKKATGQQGRLTAFTAVAQIPTNPEALKCLPNADTARGIYTHARTRIDGKTGTAADKFLFQAEAVAPGTVFKAEVHLDLRGLPGAKGQAPMIDALAAALAALNNESGVPCGRGQTQGQGRLKLDIATVTATLRELDRGGNIERKDRSPDFRERIEKAVPAGRGTVVEDLILTCKGPYITVDSSKFSAHGDQSAKAKAGEETTPQISPVQADATTPMVSGSAILGVLRARARWLMALKHVGHADLDDDPERVFRWDKGEDPTKLTPIQRLFGVTGWRGTLQIGSLHVVSKSDAPTHRRPPHRPITLTSVALDQFSGAPLEGALFTTAAHVGVAIHLRLIHDKGRPLPEKYLEADQAVLNELKKDLCANGLMLGHGTNKGYGWFEIDEDILLGAGR